MSRLQAIIEVMRVLLVESEKDLLEVIAFFLESRLNAKVERVRTATGATALLKDRDGFDAIVCDISLEDGTAEDVVSQRGKVPFILIAEESSKSQEFFKKHSIHGVITKPDLIQPLLQLLSLLPHQRESTDDEFFNENYYGIDVSVLRKFGQLSCDLYVALADDKFVKVMHEGEIFEEADFQRFQNKKIERLYVRAQDCSLFFERLTRSVLANAILAAKTQVNPSRETLVLMSRKANEIIADFIRRVGTTEETKKLVESSVSFAVQSIRQSPKLEPLLAELLSNPEEYLASHSVAVAHVACGIASNLGWTSELTFYKLTLAAFLHDLPIRNPALTRLQTLEDLDARSSEFSTPELLSFRNHPEEAAWLSRQIGGGIPDVDAILAQHHERPDETGFPRKLNGAQIAPLSAVFIVAHALVLFYIERGPKGDLLNFLNGLPPAYSRSPFKEVLNAVGHSIVGL